MTPTQLLQHFDRLSEAPDAIPRLRHFILDLAVRGKLVEQDPNNDEPAAELLKRIQKEKAALIKNGILKESKLLTIKILGTDKIPYEIPANWKWVPLGESVNNHLGGGTPSKNNLTYWDGDIFWASVKDVGKGKYIDNTIDRITEAGLSDSSSNLIPPGNLIVVTRMGLGKISINRVPIAINQDLRALSLSSLAVIDYYYIFFKTHGFEGTGLTVKGIKVEELMNIAFPLPPLAEQHRIVAKVDELMGLCDQLDAAKKEREQSRDRLLAANLHHLNQPADDEEAFREHVRFTFNHLPRITTRPAHIKQLRQTILNLAVRGKLVPQDSNDEPAAELLKRVQAEKAKMVKLGHIKAEKTSPPFEENNTLTPRGWSLCRWNSIAMKIGDIDHKMPETVSNGVPYVSPRDFYPNNVINFDGAKHISQDDYLRLAAKIKPDSGDLIYPRYGTIGENRLVMEQREFLASYSCAVIKTMKGFIDPKYQYIFSISGYCKDQAKAAENKTTQANVGIASIQQYIVPLPPLAEQQRIVAKVDELMALCDQLETQLDTTETDSRRLLEAVLHEVLAPALEKVA